MKKRLRVISLSILGILLAIVLLQQKSDNHNETVILHGDYPVYEDANQLVKKADLVFEGVIKDKTYKLLDIRTYKDEKDPTTGAEDEEDLLPYTIYDIEIKEVYKGNYDSDSLKLKVLGGEMNGKVYEMEDAIPIQVGGEYLFNVSTYEDSEATLLNMTQAIYDLNAPSTINEEDSITISDIIKATKEY